MGVSWCDGARRGGFCWGFHCFLKHNSDIAGGARRGSRPEIGSVDVGGDEQCATCLESGRSEGSLGYPPPTPGHGHTGGRKRGVQSSGTGGQEIAFDQSKLLFDLLPVRPTFLCATVCHHLAAVGRASTTQTRVSARSGMGSTINSWGTAYTDVAKRPTRSETEPAFQGRDAGLQSQFPHEPFPPRDQCTSELKCNSSVIIY